MTSPLRLELQRWGEHQSQRYARTGRAEDAPGSHPLARAREFAPETRERAAKLLAGRDGRSRRLVMGRATGTGISPAWASDPIPCTETRTPGPTAASFDRGMPPEYRWVEQAIVRLARTCPVQAAVLRVEFTVAGSQGVKARAVAAETGAGVSRWQYRRHLALALAFMEGFSPVDTRPEPWQAGVAGSLP